MGRGPRVGALAFSYPEILDWREDLERAEREARELLDEQVKKVEGAGRQRFRLGG